GALHLRRDGVLLGLDLLLAETRGQDEVEVVLGVRHVHLLPGWWRCGRGTRLRPAGSYRTVVPHGLTVVPVARVPAAFAAPRGRGSEDGTTRRAAVRLAPRPLPHRLATAILPVRTGRRGKYRC